jgi:hypothetical protein
MKLGKNEISGFCLPYKIGSDDAEIFMVDSLAGADGQQVLLLDHHVAPIGMAELRNSPEGVWFQARVCNFLILGQRILKRLHDNPGSFELCLGTLVSSENCTKEQYKGREITLIHKATAQELSFINYGALPKTKVTDLGPLDLKNYTEWDKKFADKNFILSTAYSFAQSYAQSLKLQIQKFNIKVVNDAEYRKNLTI